MKAYVRKRGGKWLLTKELGQDERGRRQRTFDTFDTEKQANKARDLFLGDLASGAYVHETDMLTRAYLERWLTDHHRRHVGPRAFERDAAIVRRHLIPALGQIPLARLRALDVERYEGAARRLDGRELSPASLRKHHWLLHSALEDAVGWEMLRRNVAAKVAPPPLEQAGPVRALSDAEKRRVLAAVAGTSLEELTHLALASGMRRGELLALCWKSDADLRAGTLTVARVVVETKGTLELRRRTKTGPGRVVRLDAHTVERLRSYKAYQDETRLALGATWHDEGLMFPDHLGRLRHPSAVTLAFARRMAVCGNCDGPAERFVGQMCTKPRHRNEGTKERRCDRANLAVRFHDLRHTHATDLLAAGVPVKVVAERIGDSVATLMRVYAHVLPDMQEAAAKTTGEVLARVLS